MTALDPGLAERLHLAADARISEQIEAGRRRSAEQHATRAAFDAGRSAGVRSRNVAREARLRMITNHQQAEENQT